LKKKNAMKIRNLLFIALSIGFILTSCIRPKPTYEDPAKFLYGIWRSSRMDYYNLYNDTLLGIDTLRNVIVVFQKEDRKCKIYDGNRLVFSGPWSYIPEEKEIRLEYTVDHEIDFFLISWTTTHYVVWDVLELTESFLKIKDINKTYGYYTIAHFHKE